MKRPDPFRRRQSPVPKVSNPGSASFAGTGGTAPPELVVTPGGREGRSRPFEGTRIAIGNDQDIVKARQEGRRVAGEVGFSVTDLVLIATAISELTRNIVRYARNGEIAIRPLSNSGRRGIEIVAKDGGPGIKDVEQVLQVGFSTSAGLGLGLPGVRRLMDEFEIQSKLGVGTTVITKKWKS